MSAGDRAISRRGAIRLLAAPLALAALGAAPAALARTRRTSDAVFAHASQKPDEWYPAHERMSRFRGMENGCDQAEAFVRHDQGLELPAID